MIAGYRPFFILVSITIVSFLAVDIFYKTVDSDLARVQKGKSLTEDVALRKVAGKPSLNSYKVVSERNLFGTKGKEVKERDINLENLEETELNLALRGTVVRGGELDYAVIKEKDKRKQGLFRVGDEVAGAEISRIMRGKVVLSVDGRDEILIMEESGAKSTGRELAAATPVAKSSINVTKEEIDSALEDMSKILTQARVRPYFSEGQADGFMISRIKKGSIFQKMGIRNGDIIQGVNNDPIKSPDDMLELYKGLKSGSQINLNIKRRGKEETLEYVFQ
ncbi:MAG: PDZ domain-containing protein [Deltaproteobacteria bacterium]|nr:PDZ domain-containing protein [Deltaproteobacteria bacterium]